MKKIFKYILCVLGSALMFAACEQSPEVLDEIDYSRVLTPTKFDAEVVPSTGTDVILTWQKIKNAESYELEIYEQTDDSKEVSTANTGTLVDMFNVLPDEIPYTVYGLEVDKSFYARVRGVNPDLQASNWAYLETTFSTSAVRASLNPVVKTRTQNSITIAWDKADDGADLTSVLVEPVVLKEGDAPETKIAIEVEEIGSASKTVTGLQPGREYRFTLLFGKAGKRGSVTANTRPNIDGTPTVISSAAALLAALDNQAGSILLMLDYSADAYDITSIYTDQTKKFATIKGDVTIYGNATEDGKKPAIKGLVFSLASGSTKLHVEDVVLDGDGTGATVENLSAEMSAIEFVNCEISGYAKGIFSVASSATGKVENYLIDGCYVHDINADGTQGGDFIDVRAGTNGDFTVKNSTFYACARTFFRMSDNAKVGNVLAENCTFNYVTSTPSSSNNAGIFAVRVKAEAKSVKAIKNVFLNEYNEKEGDAADKGWVRLCRNSTDSYRVECSGNVYFNTGVAWWTSNAVASPADALGEKTFEEIAKTDATELTADPCVNSAAGKLYLAGTAGDQIRTLKAGDPRWWDAVMPVVVRETELKLVEEAYTWNFCEKTIYDTEELTANTIIGNARIYATSSVPANVVMSKGIVFSAGASVSPAGVPTYSAVEVLVKDFGSVKVTATSDDGLGSMQVLAAGDRYPVLADGKEHTVLLGDLSGENSIYVIADKPVTLQKVVWSKDLTPDATVTALKKPAVTVEPSKLDEGTAQDVVISWGAVENAAEYELEFNGAKQTLTETSYTIAAADVAALAVGEYPVSVIAKPVATSSKYVASEAGEGKLKINKVVTGGEKTLTWNFTDAAWQTELASKGAAGSDITNWVSTLDGLTWTSTAKSKWNNNRPVGTETWAYIQAGGKGSATDRVFSFTAPAAGTLKVTASNTGSSEDLTRMVTVKVGDAAEQSVAGGVATTATPKVCEFEIEAGEVKIYPTGNALCFYKIEFTYFESAPAAVVYDWNFTDAAWQTELASKGAAGSDITNWVSTLDGLTWTSTAKSKWNNNRPVGTETWAYIQAGGKGSATDRVFSFTAPTAGTLTVWATNTGSSEDLTRMVTVKVGDAAEQSVAGGVATTAVPKECVFEIEAGEVKIYPTGNALCFYHIKFVGAGGSAKEDHVWNFTDAAWQTELASKGAAGSDITNWVSTLDGLTWTSTAKSKWNNNRPVGTETWAYIQAGGKGSATDRVFSFTAPAAGTLKVTASNTGSSEDLTRMVTVKVGDAAEQSVAGGVATTATPKVCEFEIEAGEVKVYPTGNALCFYKIEFHSN